MVRGREEVSLSSMFGLGKSKPCDYNRVDCLVHSVTFSSEFETCLVNCLFHF